MDQKPGLSVKKSIDYLKQFKDRNWGIRSRVLLLVLIPAAAIAVALSVFFVSVQIDDLETSLKERAHSLINQLATVSSHYKLQRNNPRLRELVESALGEADVLRITIHNNRNKQIITVANPADKNVQKSAKLIYRASIIRNFKITTRGSKIINQARTLGWIVGEFTHKNTAVRKRMVVLEGFFITLIGLIISTWLALRMGKNVTEPIIRLTETVRDMAEGKLDRRVDEQSKGEIGTLEEGINTMGSVLQETHGYLQKQIELATSQLRNALSEMELQNEELDKARKQALEMSVIKTEFLANMSHELRTPLNGILGFTNLLLKTDLNETQHDQVKTIRQSTTALLTVINDTLDFSRIEAGNFRIDNIPCDLREISEDAVTLLTPDAYDKGLDLILMLYSDVPRGLVADAVRIRQIITNLVSNAIKFTTKGSITLRIALEEETKNDLLIRVSVQDTGVGIRPSERNALFDPYVKAESSVEGKYGSVRLGLVICKKLVESMGGEIGVDSKAGQGSTFWFTFRASIDKSRKKKSTNNNPFSDFQCLLYDANELSRLAIIHQISDWGMEIVEADNHDDVAKKLQQPGPGGIDLVMLALNKEELETNAFKRLVKSIPKDFQVPVIVMATSVNKTIYADLIDQGASLVVPKTLRAQQLFDKLCHTFRRPEQEAGQNAETTQLARGLDLSGLNVLVVDDNKINRKLIQALLEQKGANIIEAKNGKLAVDIFAAQHIDFILMDIQMPVLSGLDATKEIRSMEHGQQRTPIVALTANIMDGDQERFIRAGFDDYIVKPIDESNLFELVVKWLSNEQVVQVSENAIASPGRETGPARPTEPVSRLFDRKQALRLTGGNMELATELFHMLVNDLPNMKKKLNQALNPLDYQKLEKVAHKIHGAASYCAVIKIKDSANLVEKAAHQKNDADIYKFAKLLNNDIDTLLQEQDNVRQQSAEPSA